MEKNPALAHSIDFIHSFIQLICTIIPYTFKTRFQVLWDIEKCSNVNYAIRMHVI